MHEDDREALETIDAAMFSGDAFHSVSSLREVNKYLERWNREVIEINKTMRAHELTAFGERYILDEIEQVFVPDDQNLEDIPFDSEKGRKLCDNLSLQRCTRCGKIKLNVDERYSYGVYAGRLCDDCCSGYRDNCGIDQEQGDPRDLDEPIEPDE